MKPNTSEIAEHDIINSATPLETEWLGRHPRLLCVRRPWDEWPERLTRAPWASWFVTLQTNADALLTHDLPERLIGHPPKTFDARKIGEQTILLAMLYRLTQRPAYRDRTCYLMQRMSEESDWGSSLIYGHWARGFAFALDWLWHDLDPVIRTSHIETLYTRSRHVFDEWASCRAGDPYGYTWNIAAVVLGGLTATAACLYGERADIAPMANLAHEKMRCQSMALGPDGVSPEGIMYGGYYASYLIINFILADDLLGGDLCGTTPWLSAYGTALHAQALPRDHWQADSVFFMQGDAHGNVFGVESVLRMSAAATGDTTAQWMADQLLASGFVGVSFKTFLLHDPAVNAVPPPDRAPFDALPDFGIALMRSDRSGHENAAVFRCGPNVGHHAARRYTHPLGGGHMHPNNGDLQIFAHGEWILRHPGYVYKDTAYHNTLLIDQRGQYGDQSEWFEDLPYRRRRRYPSMVRMEHHGAWDYCVADLIHAYPADLRLITLRRHLLYLRPAIWILIDELDGQAPVTLDALFHTGFAMDDAPQKDRVYGTGRLAACRFVFHAPSAISIDREEQVRLHSGGAPDGTLHLVRMRSRQRTQRTLAVTEIQAFPVNHQPDPSLDIQVTAPDQVEVRHPALDTPWAFRGFGQD